MPEEYSKENEFDSSDEDSSIEESKIEQDSDDPSRFRRSMVSKKSQEMMSIPEERPIKRNTKAKKFTVDNLDIPDEHRLESEMDSGNFHREDFPINVQKDIQIDF